MRTRGSTGRCVALPQMTRSDTDGRARSKRHEQIAHARMPSVEYDARTIALVLARGRVVFGLVALVVPGLVAKAIFGSNSVTARAALRMVGVRDVALGVGAITNLKEANQDAEWV